MKNLFQIDLQLEKVENTKYLYNGNLSITAKKTVETERIGVALIKKLRIPGGFRVEDKMVSHSQVSWIPKTLEKEQTYQFPFRLTQDGMGSTYTGIKINATVFFEVEVKIYIEKESYKALGLYVFRGIDSRMSRKREYTYTKVFVFNDEETTYQLPTGDQVLRLKSNNLFTVLFSFMWLCPYWYFFDMSSDGLYWMGLAGMIVMGFVTQQLFVDMLIGEMVITIQSPHPEYFIGTIKSKNSGYLLSSAKIYYKVTENIIESVGGDGGTAPRSELLFESDVHEVALHKGSAEVKLFFPDLSSKIPTIITKDFYIKWMLTMQVLTSLGLTLTYELRLK